MGCVILCMYCRLRRIGAYSVSVCDRLFWWILALRLRQAPRNSLCICMVNIKHTRRQFSESSSEKFPTSPTQHFLQRGCKTLDHPQTSRSTMLRSRLTPSSAISTRALRNQSQRTSLLAGQKRYASYKEIKASFIQQSHFSPSSCLLSCR